MRAQALWKIAAADWVDLFGRLIALLTDYGIRFCMVGDHAINAYVEPLLGRDLDVVIALDQFVEAERLLRGTFTVESLPQSLNVTMPGSDLRVQIQTDPRCAPFVDRAESRDVLGVRLPVARLQDVLQGKVWAVTDPTRPPSKRQKDLADIARLLEARPTLRQHVPPEVLSMLL